VIDQGTRDEVLAVADPDLLHIARVGTQQRNPAPVHVGGQRESIECIVLRFSIPDPREQRFEYSADPVNINGSPGAGLQGEIMNPVTVPVPVQNLKGVLTDHPEPDVLKHRNDVGKGSCSLG